jgi:glucose/arabinose dehydrogenase
MFPQSPTQLRRSLIVPALFALAVGLFAGGCEPPATDTTWELTLTRVAGGFTNPTALAAPPDGSGRLFITEQTGLVKVIDASGRVLTTPFLDLRKSLASILPAYDESGLLGMAFHPDYAANGRFFLYYTAQTSIEGYHSTARVSEFTVSRTNPDVADPRSEVVLLETPQPQANHNGGQLAFGPDGYLYIGIGDGGGSNDVGFGHTDSIGNAQDLTNLLGTILRLDVSIAGQVSSPDSNPFIGHATARPEIYAYGFRNPWRFAFDRQGERRLFCGDVGQSLFEEISIVTAGGNYGWNIKEGPACFDPANASTPLADCPDTGYLGEALIDPVIAYPHPGAPGAFTGRSIAGGYVYRGTALDQLSGRFVFGDWSSSFLRPAGAVLVAIEDTGGAWSFEEAAIVREGAQGPGLDLFLLSFGEDESGELYLLTSRSLGPTGNSDEVYKITGARRTAPQE